MVRVGGGWDTLEHYLDKHDPCRCRLGHRGTLSSRVVVKQNKDGALNPSQVTYERYDSDQQLIQLEIELISSNLTNYPFTLIYLSTCFLDDSKR